jgi:hypothetical protein
MGRAPTVASILMKALVAGGLFMTLTCVSSTQWRPALANFAVSTIAVTLFCDAAIVGVLALCVRRRALLLCPPPHPPPPPPTAQFPPRAYSRSGCCGPRQNDCADGNVRRNGSGNAAGYLGRHPSLLQAVAACSSGS